MRPFFILFIETVIRYQCTGKKLLLAKFASWATLDYPLVASMFRSVWKWLVGCICLTSFETYWVSLCVYLLMIDLYQVHIWTSMLYEVFQVEISLFFSKPMSTYSYYRMTFQWRFYESESTFVLYAITKF